MSTTTSHTPPESEGRPEAAAGPGGLPAPSAQNETTAEIPVPLPFPGTPDPSYPVKVPLKPAVPRRSLPEVDPELAERPARVLPGAAGVLAGACGVAGCVATTWWAGLLPRLATHALGLPVSAGAGLGPAQWAAYAGAWVLGALGFGGLTRGRTGRAWVLGLFGRYRGTVRRTGLLWVNPLLPRHAVDVRLRHWRSEEMPAADPDGAGLRVQVLVVWRVRDTARAVLGVEDHETYLRACVETALARVPVEPEGEAGDGMTEAGDALTRLVAAESAPVGLDVFSVQPVRVEYAPEIAAAMHRRRIARLDARQRAGMLSSVVDSVEDTVTRLTGRGLVELDDHERKVLVRDLTVAFCSGRGEPG
ncbi:SPFH domain-containing protein [Streptomyces sp. NPDC004232]|uniref:SPFH domain-containing protein n=1 Tax=Streptomyces sp. NPDC004232 TaxID=3154454 RepID=UPI001D9EB016|nr:SPFH domain-containing protein [Streptomyces sp. tea 10]